MWREDFDPVPEWVARVEAVVAGQRLVDEDRNAGRGQTIAQACQVVDEERWVGLPGRDEAPRSRHGTRVVVRSRRT